MIKEGIKKYGKPAGIQTDHGSQFCCNIPVGKSEFDIFCGSENIRHILGGIGKPGTQGKVERVIRTEFLKIYESGMGSADIGEIHSEGDVKRRMLWIIERAKADINRFIERHNCERTHWAAELMTPGSVYFKDSLVSSSC